MISPTVFETDVQFDLTSFEQFLRMIDGKTIGALRASIGLASNFADVYTYAQFAYTFIDRHVVG